MAHELIPGLEGIPIAESQVSFVDGQKGRLEYRGISVEDLAENSTFEETAFLLMYGHLPSQSEFDEFKTEFTQVFRLKYQVVDLIKCLPETGHPMDALQAAIAAIGMFYEPRSNLTEAQRRQACLRIMAKTPCVVSAFERLRNGEEWPLPLKHLGLAANFLYMMTDKEPDPLDAHILDVCLILHADHTMNASTFAGRVVCSTLADPYTVVSSALGALSGPLHGGANEDAMRLFESIGTPENARPYIEDMIKNKKKIPGFGHRVYKTIDPRAKILKKHAESLANKSGNPIYQIAVEAEKVVEEHYAKKGIWPNVDFFSGIVYSELGIPRDCFTPIFAIARAAGWLAHLLEQLQDNRIFRPTQKYTGQHDQPYVSMNER